jgi:hypothetical protein
MPKRKRIKHQGGAPKSYLRRLPKAIEVLEVMQPLRMLGHEWVSDHLGVSKATAIRILNEAGAELTGNTLVIEARDLWAYLEKLQHNPQNEPELRRQTRTAKTLQDMARYMIHRQTMIAGKDNSTVAHTMFKNILSKASGISLTPSRLVINFEGSNDFLQKFAMVVYALQNDFDEMRQYLDTTSRDKTPV